MNIRTLSLLKYFVKANKSLNKYYHGPFQTIRNKEKIARMQEKMLAEVKTLEGIKLDILFQIDQEIGRLTTLQRGLNRWDPHTSEYYSLDIKNNTLFITHYGDTKKYPLG